MRDQSDVLQDLINLVTKKDNGEINSQELYELYEPLLIELTQCMYFSNIKTERIQVELKEMQIELKANLAETSANVASTHEILEEMQTYDITIRASYNFIHDKGYTDEFYEYLSKGIDGAVAEIRRRDFKLIQNLPN